VGVDDTRDRLERVLVGAVDTVLCVGEKLKSCGRNLVSTVKALAHELISCGSILPNRPTPVKRVGRVESNLDLIFSLLLIL